MIIGGLDIETTGLENTEHRIIEIYLGLWDLRSKSLIREFETRIDPQRSILADASRIHHIFAGDLVGKPLFKDVAAQIVHFLSSADLLVGHNGEDFDLPFINTELKHTGFLPITTPIFDTMKQGRHATFDGKLPNLGELCLAYDVPYDTSSAHAASYDVGVMMECFFRGLDWGYFKLEEKTLEHEDSAAA